MVLWVSFIYNCGMGGSVNFPPSEDGSAATVTVAELIAGLVLPSIASLATDTAGLAELPPLPGRRNTNPDAGTNPDSDSDSDSDCGGGSQLEAVQWLLDGCTDAVAALRAHQNRCAGLAVVLIERCEAVAALESGLLSLDRWQHEQSMAGLRAELALLLRLPEGATERLMAHSTALVRELPATMEALSSGVLGWEFAVIIAEETTALREAGLGQELLDSYEQALLGKAAQGTINGFKDKARRLRERSHPETLTARTRRAYTDRQLRVSRARDGMSWLSIYAPAPTIEGIWDQCTLTAQAAQGPHEQRTLTQLRADVAAALLLNQSMAHNNIHTPPNTYTPASSHAPASSTTTPAGTNTNTSTGSYSGNSAGTRHQPGPVPTYAPEPMQNPGPVTSPDPARDPGPDPDPGRRIGWLDHRTTWWSLTTRTMRTRSSRTPITATTFKSSPPRHHPSSHPHRLHHHCLHHHCLHHHRLHHHRRAAPVCPVAPRVRVLVVWVRCGRRYRRCYRWF